VDAPKLAEDDTGEGRPVVLLHGLTATRRYVVMGSKALERSGHRVLAYDARGHGASAPGASYDYPALTADLERVMDKAGMERAVLAGASMGGQTALAFALAHPECVSGLVVITPAYECEGFDDPERLARWDALARGLRSGGVEGFVRAYGEPEVPPAYRETVLRVLHQRLSQHAHPEAVADALEQVPRSAPFPDVADLAAITAPTVVVADNDDADPGHPFAIGEAYAATIPGARLVTEAEGESPLAWQGSRLSKVIAEVAAQPEGGRASG